MKAQLADNFDEFLLNRCFCEQHFLDMKTLCKCVEKHNLPSWCVNRSDNISNPFCILDGGLKSIMCPGAKQLVYNGQKVDDYFSSHPSICNKTERKYKNRIS